MDRHDCEERDQPLIGIELGRVVEGGADGLRAAFASLFALVCGRNGETDRLRAGSN